MKVAYVLPYLQKPTGWRTHSLALINAMCRHVEPVLFTSIPDQRIARSLFPALPIHPLPVTQQASLTSRHGARLLATCFWAVNTGRFPEVDLVHSLEAYPTGLVGSWLANKLQRLHVITTHGTYGVVWYKKGLDRLAYERVLRKTALVCPVSQGTANLLLHYFGKALVKTRVLPILNGNNYYKAISTQEAINRPAPPFPTLLTVGEIKPRKGQHLSLAAFSKVKRQLPEARYVIIGNYRQNEYYRQLQQFISDHQLQDVTFLGSVSEADLRRHYREASVFVLTPQPAGLQFEGFGLVYLEAGAYGLPVVATRTGGVPDAVKNGETGILAPAGDVDRIAEAILQLLTDTNLAQRMGRANRRWAESLSWESQAKIQYQAYVDILSGGGCQQP